MDRLSYLYILATDRNGTLYVGATTNLIARVWHHKNESVAGFTSRYSVKKLVYYQAFGDLNLAFYRERQIKVWKRAWKIRLIEEMNPYWNDLYESIL